MMQLLAKRESFEDKSFSPSSCRRVVQHMKGGVPIHKATPVQWAVHEGEIRRNLTFIGASLSLHWTGFLGKVVLCRVPPKPTIITVCKKYFAFSLDKNAFKSCDYDL